MLLKKPTRKIIDSHLSLESLNPEEKKKLLDNYLLKNAVEVASFQFKMNCSVKDLKKDWSGIDVVDCYWVTKRETVKICILFIVSGEFHYTVIQRVLKPSLKWDTNYLELWTWNQRISCFCHRNGIKKGQNTKSF